MTISATKTAASSVLLWFRTDLPRAKVREHWRGPHAQLVAHIPGFIEYRQHHFVDDEVGLWPEVLGVETTIPAAQRVDGMPEVIVGGPKSPERELEQSRLVFMDEANVFARTVLYVCGPDSGRSYALSRGRIGARVVVLLRRGGEEQEAFERFVNEEFGPRLAELPSVRELHTQVFQPWNRSHWDTPGVSHSNPADEQFHASLVLGFADVASRDEFLGSAEVKALNSALAESTAAVHAYGVEATYIYVTGGRVTLPQEKPVHRPPVEPLIRVLPPAPARALKAASDVPFPDARLIALGGSGAEDVVADAEGRLLCGLEDGRIVRIDPSKQSSETVGNTGGRPLGLEVLPDGKVLVSDARRGLLRLDPENGSVESLVRYVDDIPLRFCSNVTSGSDGTYWFTQSSERFDFEHYFGAMLEHRPSGRLLRRQPDGRVDVLLENLHFANGVTLTEDESALIFAETDGYKLSKLWLKGPKTGRCEVIADNLPGFPDNLSRTKNGRFWVAFPSPRSADLDAAGQASPEIRQERWMAMAKGNPEGSGTTWAMCFDVDGKVVTDIQTARPDFSAATGVVEVAGKLYLASTDRKVLLEVDLGRLAT